jgi:hypothetical protein
LTVATSTVLIAEQHDPNCAGCHLPPEVQPVARLGQASVDLASSHGRLTDTGKVRCIDCHGGPGPKGRLRGLRLAATDGWAWATGDYVVVGTEYAPLGRMASPLDDTICSGCHIDTLADDSFPNHFHYLLTDAEAPDELRCAHCHTAHKAGPPETAFTTDAGVAPTCHACHLVMGGPSQPLR